MRKFLFTQLLLLGCFLQVFSQSLVMTKMLQPTQSTLCAGAKFIIAYQKKGDFNSDNKIKLQLINYYDSSKVLVDIDTKDSSGYLVGAFPDFQQIPEFSNSLSNSYGSILLQIASTSPAVVSAPLSYSSVALGVRPNIRIDTTSTTIARDKVFQLKISGSATSPIAITTSEGTVHSVQHNSLLFVDVRVNTYPNKSGNFYIKEVSNICGIGTSQGKIKLSVSDNSLHISNLSSTTYCTDGNIKLSIEKRGTWNADNKFMVRFITSNNPAQYYDVEAKESDGIVSAKIPGSLPRTSFNLSVVATSPFTISPVHTTSVNVKEEAKIDILPEAKTVRYGNLAYLDVNYSGLLPITFELTDGYQYYLSNNETTTSIPIYPTKTLDYKINKFASECNTGEGVNVSRVTVTDAIKVEEILTKSVCTSGVFKVRFSSQPVMEVNTAINMALLFSDGNKTALTGKVTEAGLAEFTFPSSSPNEGKTFTFGLSPNLLVDSTFEYGTTECLFKSIPKFTYTNLGNPHTIEKPSWVYGSLGFSGGGSIEYEDNFGKKSTLYIPEGGIAYFNSKFYVSDNTTYKVNKVSNECGVNSDMKLSFDIQVLNPIKTLKLLAPFGQGSTICAGSTQELTLQRNSTFNATSRFFLDYVDDTGKIIVGNVGEFINDKLLWKVPIHLNAINLQVRATVPSTTGERYFVEVADFPSYSGISEFNTSSYFGPSGAYLKAGLRLDNQLPTTAVFDDGLRATSSNGGILYFTLNLENQSNFAVKKLTNGCATKDVDIKFNVKFFDRIVEFKGVNSNITACAGKKIELKYAETITRVSKRVASYKLMLLKTDETPYSKQALLTGIRQSPFEVILPQDIAEGDYTLRLVDESDSLLFSNIKVIRIQQVPNVSVVLANNQKDIELSYGESIPLSIVDNGNSTFEGVIRGKTGEVYPIDYSNYSYIKLSPSYSTVYTLPSVSNQCGVQDLNFSLNVRVKPQINWSVVNQSPFGLNNICRNDKLQINLASYGDVDTTQLYKVSLFTSESGASVYYEIAKIKPYGRYSLSIPANVPLGSYAMVLQNISTQKVDFRGSWYGTLLEVPELTIAGNVTTVANQAVILTVKSTSTAEGYYLFSSNPAFELSNGSIGKITNWSKQSGFVSFVAQKSETVTLKSVSNQCGVAAGKGSATITVLPESAKYILTMGSTLNNGYSYLCAGTETNVGFKLVGITGANPSLGLEMSDSSGVNFKEIETLGASYTTNTISFKIPNNTPAGQNYRFRVIAKESGINSTTSVNPLEVIKSPSASFDTTVYYFSPEKKVDLKVKLTGNFPVSFKLGTDELNAKDFSASTSAYTVTLNPTSPTKFRLFKVSDYYCSTGIIGSNSTVSLELVTGFEDIQNLGVTIGPNPATDFVMINTDENGIKAELVDVSGNVVSETKLQSGSNQLDLKNYPNGMYLLRISKDQKVGIFKLMKF